MKTEKIRNVITSIVTIVMVGFLVYSVLYDIRLIDMPTTEQFFKEQKQLEEEGKEEERSQHNIAYFDLVEKNDKVKTTMQVGSIITILIVSKGLEFLLSNRERKEYIESEINSYSKNKDVKLTNVLKEQYLEDQTIEKKEVFQKDFDNDFEELFRKEFIDKTKDYNKPLSYILTEPYLNYSKERSSLDNEIKQFKKITDDLLFDIQKLLSNNNLENQKNVNKIAEHIDSSMNKEFLLETRELGLSDEEIIDMLG